MARFCIKHMKLIVKYFLLADFFLFGGGGILDLDKNIFPWQTCFPGGSCLRLDYLAFG